MPATWYKSPVFRGSISLGTFDSSLVGWLSTEPDPILLRGRRQKRKTHGEEKKILMLFDCCWSCYMFLLSGTLRAPNDYNMPIPQYWPRPLLLGCSWAKFCSFFLHNEDESALLKITVSTLRDNNAAKRWYLLGDFNVLRNRQNPKMRFIIVRAVK